MSSKVKLVLSDGKIFEGKSFGYTPESNKKIIAEVVFNTSLYGYQEIISDPSYKDQMLCFTNPHIGNVGCNPNDDESEGGQVSAVLVKKYSKLYSNFRATQSLEEYLIDNKIPGVYDLDTRAIVRHLRDNGALMGILGFGEDVNDDELIAEAQNAKGMEGRNLVDVVSCKEPYQWLELPWNNANNCFDKLTASEVANRPLVAVLDCGVKKNILRLLLSSGFRVTVLPSRTTAEEILNLEPRALFLSNGPGDPATLTYIVDEVRKLVNKVPIFGICLGHQILSQAIGAKTYKMKFGHRGGNHPVKDKLTSKIEITVQNHGFAVCAESMNESNISHINLNDNSVEGLELDGNAGFSVQYHPEASPGPFDSQYLFEKFYINVEKFYA